MLQQHLQRYHQLRQLEQLITAMPDYPIYRDRSGRYSIYIDGRLHHFASAAAAQLGQLVARAHWLRKQCDAATEAQ